MSVARIAAVYAIWMIALPTLHMAEAPPQSPKPPADKTAAFVLPADIPLFPLPDPMLFPGVSRPFLIFEPRYRTMVRDVREGNRIIGMATLRPGWELDYEGRPPVYAIGCAGLITDLRELPDGRFAILLRGLAKFRI